MANAPAFFLTAASFLCAPAACADAFDGAVSDPANCVVAEEIGLYSGLSTKSLLQVRCDGSTSLFRTTTRTMVRHGTIRGEFKGAPLQWLVQPEVLAAFALLPAKLPRRPFSMPPHGTMFKLAIRTDPSKMFTSVSLADGNVFPEDEEVITFRRAWNAVWTGIDSPAWRFQ